MRWSSLVLSSAFLVFSSTPAPAAPGARVHHYVGSDNARWKTENLPATLTSTRQAGLASSIVYAGGTYPISIVKMAVDGAGNAYVIGNWLVTGAMYNPSLPLPPAIALSDIVVSKIDPTGAVVYVTHLGGKGNDTALGIAVDASGNVYGVGFTTSQDFPLRHAVQTVPGSADTGFVFKLDSSGDLAWSTYFGGSGLDAPGGSGSGVDAVAVDAAGNAYVTGISDQANLITTAGAFQTTAIVRSNVLGPARSAFVAKFGPAGALVYSTWLGGSAPNCVGGSGCVGYARTDDGLAIAVDSGGNAYVAGTTNSTDFPVTPGAFQTNCACPPHTANAFVTKLNPAGAKPVYSTYLGQGGGYPGISASRSGAITVDSGGKAYVALPAAGPPNTTAFPQSFVAALNPAGSALAFSTYLGETSAGGTSSVPTGIALDANGDVFLSGTTHDATFPDSLGAFSTGPSFVMELSPGVTKVLFSVRLLAGTVDADVAIDPATGNVVTAGSSGYLMRLSSLSSPLPPVLGVGNAANGTLDSGVTPMEIVSIYGIGIGPKTPVTARPSAGVYPTSLGGVQVFFNHQPAPLLYVSGNLINTVVSDNSGIWAGDRAGGLKWRPGGGAGGAAYREHARHLQKSGRERDSRQPGWNTKQPDQSGKGWKHRFYLRDRRGVAVAVGTATNGRAIFAAGIIPAHLRRPGVSSHYRRVSNQLQGQRLPSLRQSTSHPAPGGRYLQSFHSVCLRDAVVEPGYVVRRGRGERPNFFSAVSKPSWFISQYFMRAEPNSSACSPLVSCQRMMRCGSAAST